MGIEALSRGAARAVFVESDRAALSAIEKNLEHLGVAGAATIVDVPIERAARRLAALAPFDLVISDPPWRIAGPAAGTVVRTVGELLAPHARVLLGHPAASPVALPNGCPLIRVDVRKWGGSGMSFFEKYSNSE